MKKSTASAGVLGAFVALVMTGFTAPAYASDPWSYVATAGGTHVQVADGVATSTLTAQSVVTGGPAGQSTSNSSASAAALGILSAGAISTSAKSEAIPDGVTLTSTAKTAGVSLLGGLIKADAVQTTASTSASGTNTTSGTGATSFVNLRIADINLPLNIPKNYVVTIPGIAQVSINGVNTYTQGTARVTQAWGLGVVLLKDLGGASAGAQVFVNPIYQAAAPTPPTTGAKIGGVAFGTRVDVSAGSAASIYSGPTARVDTPYAGSNGVPVTNSTAGVNVPGVLTTGVVTSSTTSRKSGTDDATITNSNELAKVNVLNGLITADAVKVTAHGERFSGAYSQSMAMQLVNLKIAGAVIPIDVAPNTTIDINGVGKVVVNQQIRQGTLNVIRGVFLTLSTAQAGLPAGATVEIGAASTSIY